MNFQMNQHAVAMQVFLHAGTFPLHIHQINPSIDRARSSNGQLRSIPKSSLRNAVLQANSSLIQWKFVQMLQSSLHRIKERVDKYVEYKSIECFQMTIKQCLDPNIFGEVDIGNIRALIMENALPSDIDFVMYAQLFVELVAVMNELLQVMRQYYGMWRCEEVSGALMHCVMEFVCELELFLIEKQQKKQLNYKSMQRKLMCENVEKDQQYFYHENQTMPIQQFSSNITEQYQRQVPKANRRNLLHSEQISEIVQSLKKEGPLDQIIVQLIQESDQMSTLQIIQSMSKRSRAKFFEFVTQVRQKFPIWSEEEQIRLYYIHNQIAQILDSAIKCEQDGDTIQGKQIRYMKWIILLYKSMRKQYSSDTTRRKWLLHFVKNKRIKRILGNPLGIVKTIESCSVKESEILSVLRNLPVCQKMIEPLMCDIWERKKHQDHQRILEAQLNRINQYNLQGKYKKIPSIQIQKLKDSKKRVITLFFSGFLSQDTCKVQEWSDLLEKLQDSQVYSIRWQSKKMSDMKTFSLNSALSMVHGLLTVGSFLKGQSVNLNQNSLHPVVALVKQFKNNPFSAAFSTAADVGQFLAQFIMDNFRGHFVNLVGFSLGTEPIKNILKRMSEKNGLKMINKVYLIGGVADKQQLDNIIDKSYVPLTITNLYSHKDQVLKRLLPIFKYSITPIGLNKIKEVSHHYIKNLQCSQYVEGHMSYRSNLKYLGELLDMAGD